MKFEIHTIDKGDRDHEDYGKSVWVAAYIDGDSSKAIGAYVTANGDIEWDDYTDWQVGNDLESMGIDPESKEADEILKAWSAVAIERGLKELANG